MPAALRKAARGIQPIDLALELIGVCGRARRSGSVLRAQRRATARHGFVERRRRDAACLGSYISKLGMKDMNAEEGKTGLLNLRRAGSGAANCSLDKAKARFESLIADLLDRVERGRKVSKRLGSMGKAFNCTPNRMPAGTWPPCREQRAPIRAERDRPAGGKRCHCLKNLSACRLFHHHFLFCQSLPILASADSQLLGVQELWSTGRDSNPRISVLQTNALTTSPPVRIQRISRKYKNPPRLYGGWVAGSRTRFVSLFHGTHPQREKQQHRHIAGVNA